MKTPSLALICTLSLSLLLAAACAPVLNGVAASCPAAAAAVAGLRAVVGALDAAVNGTSCAAPSVGPGEGPSSIKVCVNDGSCSTVDACETAASDDDCNTCAKSMCCAEAAAFAVDPVAPCLVGCQVDPSTATDTTLDTCTALCGARDAAYDGIAACLAKECASECPALAQ